MVSQLVSLEEIREGVRRVCAGRPIKCVELFGSRAAGTSRSSSDVDLLVGLDENAKIGLFELGAIREDLADSLGADIDIVSRAAVEGSRNVIRRDSILSHTVSLYEPSKGGLVATDGRG